MISVKNKIVEYFDNKDIESLYIFGSFVKKELREDSDIDIAVIGTFNFKKRIEYIYDLEKILNAKIDLIDFNKVDLLFQIEIITNGKCLFCKDRYEKEKLEMKILSKYLTLEEDRKVVIESIYKRGTVFL